MNSLIAGTWLMFRTHLWTVLRSRRALICLVLALAPPVISLLPPPSASAAEVASILGLLLLLQVIAPLIGLIAGSAVLTEEIENRTITYVFTRPVHRAALFLGRYLATLVLVTGLLAPSALGVAYGPTLRPDYSGSVVEQPEYPPAYWRGSREMPDDLVTGLVSSAVLAGAIYSLLVGGLGVFVRRPMVVGLFYLVAMEGFLANVPGSSQKLTFQYYLRGILTRLGVEENAWWIEGPETLGAVAFLSPTESAVRLLILMGVTVVVSTWAIRRRQFVLTS